MLIKKDDIFLISFIQDKRSKYFKYRYNLKAGSRIKVIITLKYINISGLIAIIVEVITNKQGIILVSSYKFSKIKWTVPEPEGSLQPPGPGGPPGGGSTI